MNDAPVSSRESGTVLGPWSAVRSEALATSTPGQSWIPVGTVDAGAVADVDPAGSVQLRRARWRLDWWIGAEDRWHVPARSASARQQLLDGAPVIETSLRVPGGDVVSRCFGAQASSEVGPETDGSSWHDPAAMIEFENLTSVPVALALVVVSEALDGTPACDPLRLECDGSVLRIDGAPAAVCSRPLLRRVTGSPTAMIGRLAAGEDEAASGPVELDPGSGTGAALVVPLPHGVTVRMLLPWVERSRTRGRREGGPWQRWSAPGATSVASGWSIHSSDHATVDLGEPLLGELVRSSGRTIALVAGDGLFDAHEGASAAARATELCDVATRIGAHDALGPVARALVASQRLGGAVRLGDRSDAVVALVHAAAALLGSDERSKWTEELLGPVAAGTRRIARGKGFEGIPAESAVTALNRLAPAVLAVGQPGVAEAALATAQDLAARAEVDPALGRGPGRAATPGTTGTRNAPGVTFFAGLDLRARVGAAARRPLDAEGSAALVEAVLASARLGSPASIADRYGPGGAPEGRLGTDAAAVAVRLGAVLDLAACDAATGPVLLPVWPIDWFGREVEVHRLRTRWGRLSFALRWHGRRPALLWEVTPPEGLAPGGDGPALRVGGLDPSWRGRGWKGEALLCEQTPPESVVSMRLETASEVGSGPDTELGPATGAAPSEGESFS